MSVGWVDQTMFMNKLKIIAGTSRGWQLMAVWCCSWESVMLAWLGRTHMGYHKHEHKGCIGTDQTECTGRYI